jgi:hypothetical protein
MTMLKGTRPSPLQGNNVADALLKSPVTERTRTLKRSESNRRSTAENRPKQVSAPIIRTRVPHGFQQAYIAANRGEDVNTLRPPPVRRPLCRTRSCLPNGLFHDDGEQREPVRRTNRSVSFGSIEGKFVENIARANKNSLWFSKDEYSAMRNEAILIASTTKRVGPLEESSQISSRGLEKYIRDDGARSEFAKKSVLEHNDIAMYALASARSVNKARQLAEMDAIEAHLIQENIATRRSMDEKKLSKRKLLNP